jgi:hypothetical protein
VVASHDPSSYPDGVLLFYFISHHCYQDLRSSYETPSKLIVRDSSAGSSGDACTDYFYYYFRYTSKNALYIGVVS